MNVSVLFKEKLKNEQLDQELKVANKIQKKLLPEKVPSIKGVNFGTLSIPARELGGDYFDFFELDHKKIGIVIAENTRRNASDRG